MEKLDNLFVDPGEPTVQYEELDFESQLKHTQKVKNQLLHALVHANPTGPIPTDKDSVELILKVADSMDKTTIAKKRVAVEEKTGSNALSIIMGIAKHVAGDGNKNAFATGNGVPAKRNDDIGQLSDYSDKFAEGEGHIGLISESSDAFNKRMDEIHQEDMRRREQELGLKE